MSLTLKDIELLLQNKESESLVIDFKECDALRKISKRPGRQDKTQDEINLELSKDVSAFLNSAGGMIIYGISEKQSRAHKPDPNLFEATEGITVERITQVVRSNVDPAPSINVYQIDDAKSGFYLVIEIPKGDTAYMARPDKRFYKRHSNISEAMEQHEVVDVLNRVKGAALEITQVAVRQSSSTNDKWRYWVNCTIRNNNYIASEMGKLRTMVSPPAHVESRVGTQEFVELSLSVPYSDFGWSVYHGGKAILPGDIFATSDQIEMPKYPQTGHFPLPVFEILLHFEIFTPNTIKKESVWILSWASSDGEVGECRKLDLASKEDQERIQAVIQSLKPRFAYQQWGRP